MTGRLFKLPVHGYSHVMHFLLVTLFCSQDSFLRDLSLSSIDISSSPEISSSHFFPCHSFPVEHYLIRLSSVSKLSFHRQYISDLKKKSINIFLLNISKVFIFLPNTLPFFVNTIYCCCILAINGTFLTYGFWLCLD